MSRDSLDALQRSLSAAFGPWGWSRSLDRCETRVREVETPEGTRHAATCSATVTLTLGALSAPLARRQDAGHAESGLLASAGEAIAAAEQAAALDALRRCALGLCPLGTEPAGPVPGVDGLHSRLEALGWGSELAAHLGQQRPARPVSVGLTNQLWRTARRLAGREGAKALWQEVGLLPAARPSGEQALQLAIHFDINAPQGGTQ